ncbi:MAG TPA: FHA domain-containing protein [Polyangiaceae bacterium]|nr:FHA domain-containing protein [Polyangiaceae bacterium]
MGRIRRVEGTLECFLEPEHLVGRGPQCALWLQAKYVSGQHCVIRWTGYLWQILDRGSRNGTRVDGQRIERGYAHDLHEGSVICFGQAEQWILIDASPPVTMLVCEQTRVAIPENGGRIELSTSSGVRHEVRQSADGRWWLYGSSSEPVRTEPQRRQLVEPNAVLELEGQRYRFVCPQLVNATCAHEEAYRDPVIEFDVSHEREFVQISLHNAERSYSLGSRSFNLLLLQLAKERLADQAAGRPAGECGWIYKSDLADALAYSPQQVDGDVHRLKRHMEKHALTEAGYLIERRPGTTQLRLALSEIKIHES